MSKFHERVNQLSRYPAGTWEVASQPVQQRRWQFLACFVKDLLF